MKALIYEKAHSLENFAIRLTEVDEPTLREFDVLVNVQAIGINPGETWIRRTRSAEPGGRVLLVWEVAGVVVAVAPKVVGFKVGDRVFGSCYRLALKFKRPDFVTMFLKADRPGFYAAVVEEGVVSPGDELTLVSRAKTGISVCDLYRLAIGFEPARELRANIVGEESIPDFWRRKVRHSLSIPAV